MMEQALMQPDFPPFVAAFTLDGQDIVTAVTPNRG
jgi:hypothetical protein